MHEPEIKRRSAQRKAEFIDQIYRGQTTIPGKAREYILTKAEIERWLNDDTEAGVANALKANPNDLTEK